MPMLQASEVTGESDAPLPARRLWWRSLVLFVLLLLSISIYVVLIGAAPRADNLVNPFLEVWIVSFVPYFVACALVLATKTAVGRWRWVELGIILMGALVLRAMLLPLLPGLSHDSWRYLWDARVILHGYSPYVYAPGDTVLLPLRDALIFGNSRYRDVPTIYPPGAEVVYVLSYLLAPSNLFVLKGLFVGFDMMTCGALALLLARRGLDPRRIIIYAWCPLPIVEFAIQGHVDVVTIALTVLAVVAATSGRRGARVLTGVLIGVATLTKIYPILLLVVLLRRRDWGLLFACLMTIFLGYLPFLIVGHGQVLGFFFTYAAEQGSNGGVTQLVVHWISILLGLTLVRTIVVERVVDVLLLGAVSLVVLVQRLRGRMSVESATLLLIGVFLSISSHVFPWYTTALLPWVVMLVGPVWRVGLVPGTAGSLPDAFLGRGMARARPLASTRPPLSTQHPLATTCLDSPTPLVLVAQKVSGREGTVSSHRGLHRWRSQGSPQPATMQGSSMGDPDHRRPQGSPRHSTQPPPLLGTVALSKKYLSLSGKGIAIAMVWYFTCTSLLSYFFAEAVNWGVYYVFVYGVVVVGLVVAGIVGVMRVMRVRGGELGCKYQL